VSWEVNLNEGYNNLRKAAALQQKLKEKRHQDFLNKSRDKLVGSIKKLLMTTAIGSLAEIENMFGELWGHGLPKGQLTKDQLETRELWEELRTKILDRVNKNIRNLESMAPLYSIEWLGYKMELRFDDN
jgi:hypothetical protein